MNTLRKHLNWTWVLAIVFYLIMAFVLGLSIGLLAPETSDGALDVMVYVLGFAIMFPMSLWVLKMKNRSLWWVLLAGWFSPLWLSNKRNG